MARLTNYFDRVLTDTEAALALYEMARICLGTRKV